MLYRGPGIDLAVFFNDLVGRLLARGSKRLFLVVNLNVKFSWMLKYLYILYYFISVEMFHT